MAEEKTTKTESNLVTTQPEVEVLPVVKEAEENDTLLMRSRLVEAVKPEFDEIVQGQIELAKGVWVKEYVKDKKTGKMIMDPVTGKPTTRVYLKAPDRETGKYLLDQVVGKPKETQVVEGRVRFDMDI